MAIGKTSSSTAISGSRPLDVLLVPPSGEMALSEEFDPAFPLPTNVFPGVGNQRSKSRALSPATFQKILNAATEDIDSFRQAYRPGDIPTSAHQLIPFMILIAARTGINSDSLYGLGARLPRAA